jgi:WXXGXW repeat (2 copies)
MKNSWTKLMLPAALMVLSCASATAQVRLGVNAGPLRIRIAPEAPPPPRVERRPSRPSRNHVWIGGYWDRQGERWDWAPGRWERPEQRGSQWIKPRYQQEGGAYRYDPGHWSHQKVEEGEDYSRWHKEHGR